MPVDQESHKPLKSEVGEKLKTFDGKCVLQQSD